MQITNYLIILNTYMIHEKTFTVYADRLVKLVIKTSEQIPDAALQIELDVLIRETNEQQFRSPIGATYPKYWKLKRLDAGQAALLQIKYSGISRKQIRSAISELCDVHRYPMKRNLNKLTV